MRKTKRLISLILVAALTLSVCLMGGIIGASAAATVIDEGNLLLNGSFEQSTSNLGTANILIANGQTNYVGVDAWCYTGSWWVDNSTKTTYYEKQLFATQYTDARTGNFALKVTNQGTGETSENSVTIYPNKVVGNDATAYADGNYKFSVWVKGTNTASYIEYTNAAGTKNTVNITDIKADEWTQVVIENIAGFGTVERTPTTTKVPETVLNLNLVVKTQDNATEILFDDISLEKTETPTPTVENLIINGFDPTNNTGSEVTLTPASKAGQWIDKSAEMTGWIYHSWGPTHSTMVLTNTDTHSAGYALKINVNAGTTDSNYTRYAAKTTNIDTSKITAGKYKLTAWVKGDATNAGLKFQDKTVAVPAEAANGWVKIETEAVTLSGASDLVATNTETNGVQKYENIHIYVRHQNQGGKYVIFDDITLEKVEEAPAENILKNSSFEEFTCSGTDEHKPGNGQVNLLVNNWYNADHWRTTETQAVVTHSTDAKSGSYSLKVDMPVNGAYFRIITPDVDNLTTLSGAYTLSFWIKGDSATVKAQSHNGSAWADVQTVSLTSEWTQVTVAIPEISYYTKNFNNDGGTNNKDTLGVCLYIKGVADKASYVLIDDISLMPADTVSDVADQITGIPQPAVGATALAMPTIDTDNDSISVSIAASSNEGVIALDGTITTPKVQTVVDVTLKISDGTNEVTLDPIGVLVHGELDKITQSVIEKAIEDLDVKATTAAADMNEINYWLEHKSGYASTASKNLYSQKKLVFEFDIVGEDSVLDKNDIIAVRDGLLGENAEEYTIRDLIKTFNAVNNYNSYN